MNITNTIINELSLTDLQTVTTLTYLNLLLIIIIILYENEHADYVYELSNLRDNDVVNTVRTNFAFNDSCNDDFHSIFPCTKTYKKLKKKIIK